MSTTQVNVAECACADIDVGDAKAFQERAIQSLRSAGHRITGTRQEVIRVLAESTKAYSAAHVHERILQSGGRIDLVSVYRILSTLLEVGAIHHIGVVDGYAACRVGHRNQARSAHFVCRSCGCITELNADHAAISVPPDTECGPGYQVESIRTELLGTCPTCSQS